jgi:hypothetical protein
MGDHLMHLEGPSEAFLVSQCFHFRWRLEPAGGIGRIAEASAARAYESTRLPPETIFNKGDIHQQRRPPIGCAAATAEGI